MAQKKSVGKPNVAGGKPNAASGKPNVVGARKGQGRGRRPEPLNFLRRRKIAMYISIAVTVIFIVTLFIGFNFGGAVPSK